MDEAQKIKQFTKYINRIVMPKFPDILGFDISYKGSVGLGAYNAYLFWFHMDGTEDEIESDIQDEILQMRDLFGETFVAWFEYETY